MPNPTDRITLDGNNNIVVHRAGSADVRIDTADAGDIHRKLEIKSQEDAFRLAMLDTLKRVLGGGG